MKTSIAFLIVLFTITSCEKTNVLPEVTFSLNVDKITSEPMKKSSNLFDEFQHKYSPGNIAFWNDDAWWEFNTDPIILTEYKITLPVGDYTIAGGSGTPLTWGRSTMAMIIPKQEIFIELSTVQLNISIEPRCSLLLISDIEDLIETARIQGSQSENDGVYIDEFTGLYYTYIVGDLPVRIFKKNGDDLYIGTKNFKSGYVYKVEVTSNGQSQIINLDDEFIEYPTLIW